MKTRDSLTSLVSLNPTVLLIIALPPPWRGIFAAALLLLYGFNYLSQVMGTLHWPFAKPDPKLPEPKQQKGYRQRKRRTRR